MCRILYLHDSDRKSSGKDTAEQAFLGLSAQQHGGQDGGGFAYTDGKRLWTEKFFGTVATQYDERGARRTPPEPYRDRLAEVVSRNPFKLLAHLRYSTSGGADDLVHFQPHYIDLLDEGRVAYAANGEIPGLEAERTTLQRQGVDFFSHNDAELTLRKICFLRSKLKCSWVQAIQEFMRTTPGAYSGILMTKRKTFLIRDTHAFRPFVVGKIDNRVIVAASETCAFDILQAKFEFEVERGTIVEIDDDGSMTVHQYPNGLPEHCSHCLFCLDYFARPDSRVFIDGRPFHTVRQKGSYAYAFGRETANEHPTTADFVASIPNSGDLACRGYSIQSGVPERLLFVRNNYVPRTFIMSEQQEREFLIWLKFGLMVDMLRKMKRVGLVDDSIVRATTMRAIVAMLREAGAEEVHIRISFPPITNPCFMGIAMPTREELIASSNSVPEIRDYLKVDSLGYLSQDGVAKVLARRGDDIRDYCTACFTGNYPIPV